ncbi:LLM class F420-dependent oxidoreductase [Skermania sp. ID1734]|uniref:LLM class F420-dependent oxidoreductase n=1 Tax=Skermania sp. ID1734 TaxID=2597516 RepID=UPI00117D9430|nr:LLM class F420-dependent oxidoreductase [Skermania sp. ID1734]TSD95138.1 LLM class F420-dependent oxidoreductase [Skermania sp. ID1734]
MRLGLHALGIGAGAMPEVVASVAGAAEHCGFATLWAGEHVVMVDQPTSRYPYAADGRIAVPADADWLDPWVCLSFAAAATTTIGIATGVLLLPEHNPVVTAKQAASLDRMSGGRLRLGIGVGWSRDEFAALDVPFERRAARTREYVAAIRALWNSDVTSFSGEFVTFSALRVYPKPSRPIPVIVGGNSDAAMRRVASWGDGWYGFYLAEVDAVAERIRLLRELCREAGRSLEDLSLTVALTDPRPEDVAQLQNLGIDELVLVGAPPPDAVEAARWVASLADQWVPLLG